MNNASRDVVVVGAGPNGLTAAAVLARAGLSVLVVERNERIGGSCRTEEVTLPGFRHDICSAIHPLGIVSPVFERLRLDRYGLEWLTAPLALAHPFDDGRTAVLSTDLERTRESLGRDGAAWLRLMKPFVERHRALFREILRPIRLPGHPLLLAAFGLHAIQSVERLARTFRDAPARALLAGSAAHSMLPLNAPGSASFGLVLSIAGHALDWPCARGGSQQIVDALAACARVDGCELRTGVEVRSLADLPPARVVLLDLTPRQIAALDGTGLTGRYRRALERFRYGPGVYKVDYALSDPIPWRAAACREASTVHVGGTFEEIARAELDVNQGRVADAPFVLVAQQSVMDGSRAPQGLHTGWVYCHVPHGSPVDVTEHIERQIERFAPGFRDTILARRVHAPAALEAHNPNLVGGDIGGGANTLGQVIFRPFPRVDPYRTPNPRLYVCSSSTPPGGGVHGMCGYWAARSALRHAFGRDLPEELELA